MFTRYKFINLPIAFIFVLLFSLDLVAQDGRRIDMGFEGQMGAAVSQLKSKMKADPDINGRKLRLGKFSGPNLPDSSFELEFEQTYCRLMGDMLTDESPLIVNGEYKILPGDLDENDGLEVIQFVISIEYKFRVLQSVTREINRSADIVRIAGATVALPDVTDVEKRNKAAFKSATDPQFAIVNSYYVTPVGRNAHRVAIFKKVGGKGNPIAVVPKSVNGNAFVDLGVSDTFSIVLENHDHQCDASADVSIDGLDVANTFSVDQKTYQGYMVPRMDNGKAGTHSIPGWLKTTRSTTDNVYEFVLKKLGHGAATEMNSRNKVGVIHVDFYEAVPPGQKLPSRTFGEVGKGELMNVAYKSVSMTRRKSPIAQISIRYRNPEK